MRLLRIIKNKLLRVSSHDHLCRIADTWEDRYRARTLEVYRLNESYRQVCNKLKQYEDSNIMQIKQ